MKQLYILLKEQEAAIQKGRTQIASGDYINHEDLMLEMKAFLNNKPKQF